MKPVKYPPLDKEVLEGRKPLPEDISEKMDRYEGTGRYINPYVPNPKDSSKTFLSPHIETMDYYKIKPFEKEESKKWNAAATELFDVNPNTLEMTPKKNPERSQEYFEILKRKAKNAGISEKENYPIESIGDPRYSQIGLEIDKSTGKLRKRYFQTSEARSLAEIDDLEQAATELDQSHKILGTEFPAEQKKQITERIIQMYKDHAKKFGGYI